MNDVRLYWLWLVIVFGPANPRIWELSRHYDTAENFVNALIKGRIDSLNERELNRVKKIKISDAQNLLEYCNKNNINVYCYESEGYPDKLRSIFNPPCVLFSYGNLDFWGDKVYIAVVGTRNPSDYSIKVTDKICRSLSKRDFIIVTGFALGIDQIANSSALDENKPTIAVCGRAIDEDYPKGSYELKKCIAENGAVISEYYPTCKPLGNAFVNRNRILAGISDAVLFCECSAESRGLDNASQAIVQGKPIFAVPPCDIFDKRYFGQRNLIRDGAVPVFDAEDILINLSYENIKNMSIMKSMGEYMISHIEGDVSQSKKQTKKQRKNETTIKYNSVKTEEKTIDYSQLSSVKRAICKSLENQSLLADEIALQTGEDISVILSELIDLEIDGYVEALAGKMYGLKD